MAVVGGIEVLPLIHKGAAAQTRTVGEEETVLIIGDARNPRGRHQFTSQTPGATSVETVDLGDLLGFARRFDIGAANALEQLVSFAAEVMTHVGVANLLARVETIRRGQARTLQHLRKQQPLNLSQLRA